MKRILYHGGSWQPNIGNAFIDYGSIHTIKTALPAARVYFASGIPRWFFLINNQETDKAIDLAELMEIDAIVISGMVFCDEFINNEGPILKKLSDRGVRIIFNGCGCETYQETEQNNFKNFLKSINVSGFISRDEITYNAFRDCFAKSYNGVDCAFFLPDTFNYSSLVIKDYVIYNFDLMKEPEIENEKRIIRTHHSGFSFYPFTSPGNLTFTKERPFIKIGRRTIAEKTAFEHQGVLISDVPDDYLNLYANAYATYSDRVHACLAALSFSNLARLYSDTPRSSLFERAGVGEIKTKLVNLDPDRINVEKEKQLSFLKEILTEW